MIDKHNYQFLGKNWESFEKLCIPAAATESQRHMLKAAFYSGAMAALVNIGPLNGPPEVAAKIVAIMNAELTEFIGDAINWPPPSEPEQPPG